VLVLILISRLLVRITQRYSPNAALRGGGGRRPAQAGATEG
jgi:hypothetical protein